MQVEVVIVKELPKKQIQQFQDKTVYYTAMLTREYVKNANAYPYLSGELARAEIQSPILGSNKEYSLLSGVKYAKHVWNMNNVQWTNKSTIPQWYYNMYRQKGSIITTQAATRAYKELK